MRQIKCDRCGCVMDDDVMVYVFYLTGSVAFHYQSRNGGGCSEAFEYDLCTDCARAAVELIKQGKKAEEGQACTKD